MSSSRLLILLAAVVIILFVVSLALSSRTGEATVDPKESWLAALAPSAEFDFSEISAESGWQNGRLTLSSGVSAGKLTISESGRKIRRLKISLVGNGTFEVEFKPAPSKEDATKFADANAAPLRIKSFKAGQKPFDLTILKHGGELVVRRDAASGSAVFQFE